jgi:hypothetical protein
MNAEKDVGQATEQSSKAGAPVQSELEFMNGI